MQKIKRKESVKLRNFLHLTIKANAWAVIAPVTTVLGGASLWLVLALNAKARTEASAFVSTLPQPLSSQQIILAASLLLPLVIAFYFWLDYQQQALLFKKEDPTFIYTALQHAKKVVLPKLKYNWKQAIYWVGYGLVTIFMIASVVAGRVQPAFAYAPDEFVTTWKTDNPGTSSSTQITIPTTGGGYNYDVDWGDGNTDTGQTGNITHTYTSAGTYEVKITGTFPQIYFNNGGDRRKILTVEQWGTNQWASMQDSFMGASNLQVPASDAPDLSNVTSLEQMFSQATAFNSSIDHWDVSNVQSFNSMFHTATSFNQPLNSWTTSSLTSMSAMFYGADSFNQPLSNWDVSGVSDFAAVFNSADAFNQSLASWDVSGATDMSVFLSGTAVSSVNYDATLVAWSGLTLQSGVTMMATGVNYCNAATERSSIISTYSWTIMDAGLDCSDQPQAFITTWKTDNSGSSASDQITIPTTGTGYNYDVDWGDGNTDTGQTGNITHTYASAGTYTVSISGDFPRIYFNNTGDRQKILTVEQWGDIGWASMERAFMGASNLQVNAVDAPDLSGVTSTAWMFYDAESLNQSLDGWGTSSITNMGLMFYGATTFNQPLNSWDTSSVTNMDQMFRGAVAFNQPLNSWDTSSVVRMESMFYSASSFNQDISSWDVSSVITTKEMFISATSFNQPLNSWNVGSVTDMEDMFAGADSFNQPLNSWNVGSVTNMSGMFRLTDSFNQPLDNWNLASPASLSNMFSGATSFNSALNSMNVSNVTDMSSMFANATAFNQPLSNWDVGSVASMQAMFGGASSFNHDISSWNVSNVGNMSSMFSSAVSFNSPLNSWDTSNVTTMRWMFAGATSFNQPINNWDMSRNSSLQQMFNYAASFNQPLNSWDTSGISNMYAVFNEASSFNQSLDSWDVSNITNMSYMFNNTALSTDNYDATLVGWSTQSLQSNVTLDASASYCLAEEERQSIIDTYNWTINDEGTTCQPFVTTWKTDNTSYNSSSSDQVKIPAYGTGYNYDIDWGDGNTDSGVTGSITHTYASSGTYTIEISGTFPRMNCFPNYNGQDCSKKLLSVEQWGDIAWDSMEQAFYGASNLVINATDAPDLSNVTNMTSMFSNASSMNSDISHWDVSNVTNMNLLFTGASSFNQPLNNWDVSSVTEMAGMLSSTPFDQNINNWNTSNVTNMNSMFNSATSFNQPLDSWDVSSVTSMSGMFRNADSFNQDISSWDVSSVTSMTEMFKNNDAYNQDMTNWNASSVTSTVDMFSHASVFNGDLSNWQTGSLVDMTYMFNGASAFNQPMNNWDVGSVTDMDYVFQGATSFNQPLDNWDTSSVEKMNGMFSLATSFNQPINSWNTGSVWTMGGMFNGASAFNQPLDNWDTADVISMGSMFASTPFNQDISSWNTGSVTSMVSMFYEATSFNQPLNNWDVSQVYGMSYMFSGATSFNQPLDSWDTSGLDNTHLALRRMFQDATSFNQDISTWDLNGVTRFDEMFNGATSFDQDLGDWDMSTITYAAGAFSGSGMSSQNYDATLTGWSSQSLQNSVSLGASGVYYCTAGDERQSIIDTYSWTISDAGKDPACSSFITTWATNAPGASNYDQITIPTEGGGYNYDVDWGDGNTDTGVNGDITHTYASAGTYTVKITGDFPRMAFGYGASDAGKLLSVEQWGDIEWASTERMFYDAVNLEINASDTPNLSNVTNMAEMFSGADTFNDDISDWDVSNVTNMRGIFSDASSFNQNISSWDVSNVTNMSEMFSDAIDFNQPLNSWDTSSVEDISAMFYGADSFNQPLDNWDVSGITSTWLLFSNASSFNQNINSWDVSNVTEMYGTFRGASTFNQPLNNWDVSNVTGMVSLFQGAKDFNQDISSWDAGSNTSLYSTFMEAISFNQPLNSWDVSQVTSLSSTFSGAASFNQPLDNWDTSRVGAGDGTGGLKNTFSGAISFNQNINSWDVSNVTGMSQTFGFAVSFNQPLNNWDTSSVVVMSGTFLAATSFNQPLDNWDVSEVEDMIGMFAGADSFDQSLANWDIGSVSDMTMMFLNEPITMEDTIFGDSITFGANGLSTANYDATLASWSAQGLQSGVQFDAGLSTYCDSESQRQSITTDFSWTINDSGKDCSNGYKQVNTLQPEKISSTQAKLKGSVSGAGAGNFVSAGFQWGKTSNYGNTSSGLSINSSKFSKTLSFECDTQYHYRAFAVDGEGQKTYGANTIFTLSCPEVVDPDVPPDTTNAAAPKARIISPRQGEGFKTGSDITLKADITVGTDPIKEVRFYINGELYKTVTEKPYETVFKQAKDGIYRLIVVVEDVNGKEYATKERTFAVNKAAVGLLPLESIDKNEQAELGIIGEIAAASKTIATTAAKNLPWILLQILGLIYLLQSWLEARSNGLIKKRIALAHRTREGLDGFLHIATHYLVTPVTTMLLSLESIKEQDSNTVSTRESLGGLKNYVNQLVADLNTKAGDVKSQLASAGKIKRHSALLWVLAPIVGAVLLLGVGVVGASSFGIWDPSTNHIIFNTVLLAMSAGSTLFFFELWQRQRQLTSDLHTTQKVADASLTSRNEFIAANKTQLEHKFEPVEELAIKILDSPFKKTFMNGEAQFKKVLTAFGAVLGLTSQIPTSRASVWNGISFIAKLKDRVEAAQLRFEYKGNKMVQTRLSHQEIEKVLDTLVENAVQFTKEGGVVLSIDGKNALTIKVTDTGSGISKDKIDTLMQPFARGTDTHTYNYEGIGLNLYIVRLIAEKYGGSVAIDSKQGHGTTIIFSVPNRVVSD